MALSFAVKVKLSTLFCISFVKLWRELRCEYDNNKGAHYWSANMSWLPLGATCSLLYRATTDEKHHKTFIAAVMTKDLLLGCYQVVNTSVVATPRNHGNHVRTQIVT